MALPSTLKAFNVFNNGGSWLNQVPSITLPQLARTMEAYQGGGMAGPVDIDMGQEKLELTFTTPAMRADAFDTYGAPEHDAHQLRFEGSWESDEDGSTYPVRVIAHGRISSIGGVEAKAGEKSDGTEWTMSCSYYKLEIDGSDAIEIDMVDTLFKVNGVDRHADRRANIGM